MNTLNFRGAWACIDPTLKAEPRFYSERTVSGQSHEQLTYGTELPVYDLTIV